MPHLPVDLADDDALLQAAVPVGNRGAPLTRTAFLYLEPHADRAKQPIALANKCGSCMMWTGSKGLSCTIHGPRRTLEVRPQDSCGFYVAGPPHEDMAGKETPAVTTDESGFGRNSAQCHACVHWHGRREPGTHRGICSLYVTLNACLGRDGALDPDTAASGCCNAWYGFDDGAPPPPVLRFWR